MSIVGDPKNALLVSNNHSEYNDLESNQDAEVFAKGGECDVDCKLLMHEVGRTVPDGTRNCARVLRVGFCGRILDGQAPEYLRLSFGIFTVIEAIAFLWVVIQYFVLSPEIDDLFYFSLVSALTLVLNFLINGVWVVTVTKLPQTCCCSRKFNAVCFFLFQTAHILAFLVFYFVGGTFIYVGLPGASGFGGGGVVKSEFILVISYIMNIVYFLACVMMWIFNVRSLLWLCRR